MKRIIWLVLFALLVFSFLSPAASHADTYQAVLFGTAEANSNGYFIYGMDDSGDFVTYSDRCGPNVNVCYNLFVSGQEVSTRKPAPPTLAYDNGTSCGVGSFGSEKICNNGREAFISGSGPEILYAGLSSDLSVVKIGSIGFLQPKMDGMGDFVFDDGNNFEEYIDVTSRLGVTPEPSSIALLGSGLIGLASIARRRCLR